MGQTVIRTIIQKIKLCAPAWYATVVDKATDVANKEQFNLSVQSKCAGQEALTRL